MEGDYPYPQLHLLWVLLFNLLLVKGFGGQILGLDETTKGADMKRPALTWQAFSFGLGC